MNRAHWTALLMSALLVLTGISSAGAGPKRFTSTRTHGHHWPTVTTTVPPSTTTTAAPTTTTTAPRTTTTAAAVTVPTSTTVPAVASACVGVAMTRGQTDIDAWPAGTAFCLSGTHNWTLTPKAGDTLRGPATLDGGNATAHAIVAVAPNVTLANLTIQHYDNGDQDGAITNTNNGLTSGWHLNDLDVGFNSNAGSQTGDTWTFTGGRYHDNHQEGIQGGSRHAHVTIDGVEIDHNNFTDMTYTQRNVSCGYEAGGVKWVANDMTIENSSIHDNACKGLWSDINSVGMTIVNNHVYNNWDEGIFIEISSNATISGNTVANNGWHNYNGGGTGCPWLFGGGITLNSSDHVTVSHNMLVGNCNGITGMQQDRPDGRPGLLENFTVDTNTVAGPGGVTGVAEDNGADLTTRQIVFTSNTFTNGTTFCGLLC
jgi:parallel beta-helix repeat protein